LERFKQGLAQHKPLIVVSDVYPTETTKYADVILPSALWVEKEGCFGNTERRTQHFPKMVEPPGEARPDVWQIVEVAKRMGHGKLFSFKTEHLERELFEEYRQFTLGTSKDLAPYEVYQQGRGLRWPVVNGKETKYRYVEGEDPYVKPGEGIQFYKNKKTDGKAVIWARPYEAPPEIPDAAYPLWLCTGRVLEHWHTGTLTRRVPELHRSVPSAYVEIHPKDAAPKGIKTGDRVRVISRRGALELRAEVDYNGRALSQPGLVFVPFFDEGKLINLLTLDALCPISKEPDYKKCAVKIEKA
jgi:nitrate reductase NapA